MRHITVALIGVACIGAALSAEPVRAAEPVMIGGARAPIVVPLEDMGPLGLYVPVTIGGQGPYRFKLSLISQTLILGSLSDALGLKPEKIVMLTSGYAHEAAKQVGAKLALGEADLPVRLFYTQPDAFSRDDIGLIPGYGGRLGFEMLQQYAVAIDFDAKTLTLSPSFAPGAGAEVVETAGAGTTGPEGAFVQRPGVEFDIDGVKARLALNLSGGTGLDIEEMSPAAAALRGREKNMVTYRLAEEDYTKDIALMRASDVRVGALALSDVLVNAVITPRTYENWDPKETIDFDGTAGLGFLRRFNIAIDRYGARIALTPRAAAFDDCIARPPYRGTGYSWSLWSDGTARVDMVRPGSPAERAGLAAGDEILAENGAVPSANPQNLRCAPKSETLSVRAHGVVRAVALDPEELRP